jgi:U6 snRNA-associated Sm-like protein LSm6
MSFPTGFMNVAMEQTEEFSGDKLVAQYGDSFIRGNNIMYISLQRKLN